MSVKGIGRRVQVGIAKESARGTANTTTGLYWLAFSEAAIQERFNNAIDEESYPVIEDSLGQTRVKNWAEGSIKAPLGVQSFGLILLALLGTDTPVTHTGESIVYDHVYSVAQNAQHQSVTLLIRDPLGAVDYSHANSVLHKLDLDYSLDKFITISLEMKGLKGTSPGGGTFTAPSQVVETRFVPQYLTFKSAASLSTLGAATAIGIKNLKLTIDENIEEDNILGSVAPRDFLNKTFSVMGELEAIWNGESDFKTNSLAGTAQALRLDLVDSGTTIGSASNPRFVIDLAKCVFTEFSRPIVVKDLVYQTVKFKAHYSSTDAQMIKATLTNLIATY